MNVVLKIFRNIITFICVILLTINISIYIGISISKKYLTESEIKTTLSKIDIMGLLTNDSSTSKYIINIKNKFIESGVPENIIDDFFRTEPVLNIINSSVTSGINYVIYDKKPNMSYLNSDNLYKYFEENMSLITNELRENNVRGSELLTEEKEKIVLEKLKDNMPIVEDNINKLILKIDDKLNDGNMTSHNQKMVLPLQIIRFIYSDLLTYILFGFSSFLILLIALSRVSIYKWMKWVGVAFLISGLIQLVYIFLIPLLVNNILYNAPDIIINFVKYIMNSMIDNMKNYGFICFIISLILFTINIVIYFVREKRENKMFDI